MTRRRIAIRVLSIAFLVAIMALAIATRPPAEYQWLSDLTDYTLAHGRTGTIPSEALTNLKLPTGEQRDVAFRSLVLNTDGPSHSKSFCVRERGDHRDILLSDAYSNRGRFFHSSIDGKLISASIINEKLTSEEVEASYLSELQFWRNWWAGFNKQRQE